MNCMDCFSLNCLFRYYKDSDYADGVDDAMDDLDEDW